jgi:hypothetical protein
MFMGTPHQGGSGVGFGRLMVNVASVFVAADDGLLRHLERDSEWLQQQLGQYGPISGDFVTKFAFEEYATPTVLGRSIVVSRHEMSGVQQLLTLARLSLRRRQWCQAPQTASRSLYPQTTSTWSSSSRTRTLATRRCQGTYG